MPQNETSATTPPDYSHERHALLLLRAMMRQHSLDEFGREPERTGCYDVVCRGIDGDDLPPLFDRERNADG